MFSILFPVLKMGHLRLKTTKGGTDVCVCMCVCVRVCSVMVFCREGTGSVGTL